MIRRFSLLATLVLTAAASGFGQTNEVPNPGTAAPAPANSTNPVTPRVRPGPRSLRPERYIGTLVKVDGTNLIIEARQPRGGVQQVTVPADSRTEFHINNSLGALKDLKTGMMITAMRMNIGPTAGKLRVIARDAELSGTLIKADGTNLVLKVSSPGSQPREVKVATDEHTQVEIGRVDDDGNPAKHGLGKIADLQPGMRVNVLPPGGTATKVTVLDPPIVVHTPVSNETTNTSTGTNAAPAQ